MTLARFTDGQLSGLIAGNLAARSLLVAKMRQVSTQRMRLAAAGRWELYKRIESKGDGFMLAYRAFESLTDGHAELMRELRWRAIALKWRSWASATWLGELLRKVH